MFLWVFVTIFSEEGNNFGIMEWLTIDWFCLFLPLFVYRIRYISIWGKIPSISKKLI